MSGSEGARTQQCVGLPDRCAKDTGLQRLPSREFAINQAWCVAAPTACDFDRLAATARPRRRPGHRRTETASLPTPAHRRPLDPRPRRRWLRFPATWPRGHPTRRPRSPESRRSPQLAGPAQPPTHRPEAQETTTAATDGPTNISQPPK